MTNKTEITFPLKLVSGMNAREHHFGRSKRVKKERKVVWAEWLRCIKGRIELPCRVTFIRIAPKAFDSDNLQSAFKGVRDEVAARLGVNDNDQRVIWQYMQRKPDSSKPISVHQVKIIIEHGLEL